MNPPLPTISLARRAPGRRAAFTLIEILVAVVILATCAAVVVPQIGSRDDLRASTAARTLVADLLYAQSRSIATCTWTYVYFEPAGNRYTLLSALPSTTITHPVSKDPYVVTYGAGSEFPDITLGAVALNSDTTITVLAFDPLGTPYAVPASGTPVLLAGSTLPVTCRAATLTVVVDPITGQIRIP